MDKDFDEEISDSSVEASDEDVMPAYSGAIRPYMFEPTMTPDEAAAHETSVMKVKSAFNERRLADISTWYGGWFTDARTL